MTTQNVEATLRVGADISGAIASLNRLQDRASQVGRRINQSTGGAAGAAVGGVGVVGRGGAGIGRIIGAGAGLGAGVAVFEQLFTRLFELFEETPVLETFTDALQTTLRAFAPVAGVLIQALTPAIVALEPALKALVPAVTPVIELLGANLLFAIQALTPAIQFIAPVIERVTTLIRDGMRRLLDFIVGLPLIGDVLDLSPAGANTLGGIETQLANAASASSMAAQSSADAAAAVRNSLASREQQLANALRELGDIAGAQAIERQLQQDNRLTLQAEINAAIAIGNRGAVDTLTRLLAADQQLFRQRQARELAAAASGMTTDVPDVPGVREQRPAASRGTRQQPVVIEQIIRFDSNSIQRTQTTVNARVSEYGS